MKTFVRFAPSPTGLLHIGNIRAALYNYLFARSTGGSFMLRLDDTDQVRSTQAFADALIKDLTWLGITWDRFARQSDRYDRYIEALEQLKASGRAYPCFETQAELDLKRKTQLGRGLPPVYDRGALKLTDAEIAQKLAEGHKPYWRFKLNHTNVIWEDGVQGHKVLPASAVSDPVLMREDGVPLYTFCSIVDDIDFGITHIIRGEDHVTNTTTQIQIWEALTSAPPPHFAHFPLLVDIAGEEMSKRLGTLSVGSMRDDSHIEAMAINTLLAKLGTSDSLTPITSMDVLVQEFDLNKVSRATPKFDLEELRHLSAKILHATPFATIAPRLKAIGADTVDEAFWNAVRTNLTQIDDVSHWAKVVHGPLAPISEDPAFLAQAAALLPPEPWDDTTWSQWTKALGAQSGRKGKDLFHPLRLALTAEPTGPELKHLLPLIGRAKVLERLGG